MNSAPPTFMHAVSRFVQDEGLDKINGRFGEISIASFKDNFNVYLEIVYQHPADSVEYRILRNQNDDPDDRVPYTFAPGDYRFVDSFNVWIYSEQPETFPGCLWTAAKLTDRTFCNWLKTPFDYIALKIIGDDEYDCSKILELLPDYFNVINADCKHSEALDRIIYKSNEEKRLQFLRCPQFYHERTVKNLLQFYMSNPMLYKCSWKEGYVAKSCAINTVFDLWIDQPEIFTLVDGFGVHEIAALTHLSRFSFGRISECNCSRLERYNNGKPFGTRCVHFKYEHRTASGRQALLTVFLKDPEFENLTSLSQAKNYNPVWFFIEFCC